MNFVGGRGVANVIVVGAQWGDEGKGKLVDILAHYFNIVARCQVFFFTTFSCSF